MISNKNNSVFSAADKSESIESENSSVQHEDKSGSGTSASINLSEASSKELDRRMAIIESEEKHVRKARYLLAVATIVCAAVVTVAVLISSKRNEHRTFENEYEIYANLVITSAEWETKHNFKLIEELSAAITSSAVMNEESFPNVTHPHYEIFSGYSDSFGGIVSTAYAPIVRDNERQQWEEYSVKNSWWLKESANLRVVHPGHLEELYKHQIDKKTRTSIDDQFNRRIKEFSGSSKGNTSDVGFAISDTIYHFENGTKVAEPLHAAQYYAPIWQITPPTPSVINENLFDDEIFTRLYNIMIATNQSVLSETITVAHLFDFLFDESTKDRKQLPHTYLMEPVYDAFTLNPKIVGVILSLLPFENLFDYILPESTKGIISVISDSCNNTMTFRLDGPVASFLGFEDHHDPSFDNYVRSKSLELYDTQVDGLCEHTIHVYPTETFQKKYETNKPALYASIVAISFVLMAILIFVYDSTVTKRQEKTMKSALKSGALIASLFPANVRERLMADDNIDDDYDDNTITEKFASNGKEKNFRTRPIADFFPNTTLMFADISGFTAWSSTRDPHQVFDLLETIYSAFDAIAKKRRIFKVETVGDCYVAVCGLPNPRSDHATAMAKFARECLNKMNTLTKELEVTLGPDTAALAFRVGLHSGPVTGGVLRGENARFQLFGDTVNTASRMESTGLPNRIQISQSTADLLIEASKGHWVVPRGEVIHAKGKGEMATYWLTATDTTKSSHSTASLNITAEEDELIHFQTSTGQTQLNEKIQRLVDWNSEVLLRLLRLVVARRDEEQVDAGETDWNSGLFVNGPILDEVVEIIKLPNFSMASNERMEEPVDDEVVKQLREYVYSIASMYRSNYFHNFEHASHVTMSVIKLLGRIVPRSNSIDNKNENKALALHDHTYGITSDPLTQFACVFAALIHDVDHEGVTNAQLVKEQTPAAISFHGKSVAEQKSLQLAWNLLMEPRFYKLRKTLCAAEVEVNRFRQLVVNAVMATDIMAPDLKAIRQRRWETAFSTNLKHEDETETINRKATIVIEHLIQASDVCHTMQHWHIYRKWNESLFQEMTKAYYDGRSDKNPADTWYAGEIGFFDYYIIPLAKKLADCGVFGVSSDEYLNYAVKNRNEWEARGKDIVNDMVKSFKK